MATTQKKTNSIKKTAKTAEVKAVKDEANKVVEKPIEEKAKPKKFEDGDLIEVINYFPGSVMMHGRKSGNVYTWDELDEVVEVEYQDIKAEMLNTHSPYIYDPLLIIKDEAVYSSKPKVVKLYSQLFSSEQIKDVIFGGDVNEIEAMLEKIPNGMLTTVRHTLSTLVENGTLDSVRIIRKCDEILGTELALLID